ncbi:phage major capsid protein (plasmid) [Microtetraspora malaysiensis]|uniref:phage major capsid protein n=1 Tax=Microtetraspora malaysiensis TaxID=161358 RepID=UPI003D8F23D7
MTANASKARLKELRGQLEVKAREIHDFGEKAIKDETGRGHFVVDQQDHARYLNLVAEGNEIKALIQAEESAAGIFNYLEAPDHVSIAGQMASQQGTGRGMQVKSLSSAFLESEDFQRIKAGGFRDPRASVEIKQGLYDFEAKDLFTLSGGTVTHPAFGRQQDVGLTERQRRPNRVRDLFPAERTDANMLWGIRQVGFTNNAKPVPERVAADGVSPATGGPTDTWGRIKKSDLQFDPYKEPIVEIGHYIEVHKNTLADEDRLRGIIDRDLIDGVKLEEDWQILFGDGQGDNMTGITNTPGIQLYTGQSSDKATAQLRRAITRSLLAFFDPNGVVMHPLDFEGIELEEDGMGAYRVAVSVAVGAEKRVWRLNVIDTPVMVQGQYLLGSYGYGAKLYDRESVTVQASTEHGENWTAGAVAIKATERVGVAVDRPESFVYGKFTNYVKP